MAEESNLIEQLLRGETGGEQNDDGEGVWNLLVQILFPLVLVLMFVLLIVFSILSQDIEKYKQAAHQRYEEDAVLSEIQTTRIELQWLKLSKNANLLDADEREDLAISYYPLAAPGSQINWGEADARAGQASIDDATFSEFCKKTFGRFESSRDRSKYKSEYFNTVLARTRVTPKRAIPADWTIFRNVRLSEEPVTPSIDEQSTFEEGSLSPSNESRLAVEVNQLVNQMMTDAAMIQRRVIDSLVEREMALRQHLGDISDEEIRFYNVIMNPNTSADDRMEAINAWWRVIYERLRETYLDRSSSQGEESARYPFLSTAFREISM